jgi:UDP:flavonoid glycosyltransferase YjiC (YdhE family)
VRILVTTLPGLGHLHPLIPFCRALRDAGHEVVVGMSASYLDLARGAGLDTTPLGPDWTSQDVDEFLPGLALKGRQRMRVFAEIAKRGIVEDIVDFGERHQPDIVVHGHYDLGGWLGAELLGIPNVPFAMTVRWLDPGLLRIFAGDQMTELLDHFGLPPDPDLTRPARWLYLDSAPRALTSALYPPAATVHHLRYETDDAAGRGSSALPGWVDRLGDRPLVYVTTGTVFNAIDGLLETLGRGAAELDVDVLLTTGGNDGDRAVATRALPDNVHIEAYVPQTLAFPRCRAVVCHGSASTVFGALAVGVPLVLVPITADHPVNAFLCERAGVGVACTTFQAPDEMFPVARPEEIDADQVTAALATVLADDAMADAARGIAAAIGADPPLSHGVALVEQLVTTGAPVLA